MPKPYPKEFRQDVVRVARNREPGQTLKQIAADFGISESCLAEGGTAAVTGFTSVARLISVSLRGGKDIAMAQAHVTAKDLELLSELIEAGKIRPQIDRRYAFADIPAAIAYLEQGHARAKVVVEVA